MQLAVVLFAVMVVLLLYPGLVLAQDAPLAVEVTGYLSVAAPLALLAAVLAEGLKRIKILNPYRDYIPIPLTLLLMAAGAGYYMLKFGDWLGGIEAGLLAAALAVFGYEFVSHAILRKSHTTDEDREMLESTMVAALDEMEATPGKGVVYSIPPGDEPIALHYRGYQAELEMVPTGWSASVPAIPASVVQPVRTLAEAHIMAAIDAHLEMLTSTVVSREVN